MSGEEPWQAIANVYEAIILRSRNPALTFRGWIVSEAGIRSTSRIAQLTIAAQLLHEGQIIDQGWLAAQLLDLRDLLAAREPRRPVEAPVADAETSALEALARQLGAG